jgi:PhnB protein
MPDISFARPTPVPDHLGTVTPRLMVDDADAALDFYQRAFGAQVIGDVHRLPDGAIVHAELQIGTSVVMLAQGEPTQALLCTYWPEVDAAWERALAAGAQVVHPLADQVYGERGGRLADPFGQEWMMAARTEELSAQEIAARMRAAAG